LESAANTAQPKSLHTFTSDVVFRHAAAWPPSEQKLAEEFFDFFGSDSVGSFENLVGLCDSLGIEVSQAALPEELRGYHHWYEEKRVILVAHDGLILSGQHTVLHELREILEHIFKELGYSTAEASLPESSADEFAVYVRVKASLQEWDFLFKAAQTVQSNWARRSAYVLIGLGAVITTLGFVLLPHLEDRLRPVPDRST
jgi:hypothetical protein